MCNFLITVIYISITNVISAKAPVCSPEPISTEQNICMYVLLFALFFSLGFALGLAYSYKTGRHKKRKYNYRT